MFNNNGYSLADIAAATGNRGDDGMFGNGAWWIIILFLFCFAGWGGNRGGGFGSNYGGAGNGISDFTYSLDAAGIRDNISNGFIHYCFTISSIGSCFPSGDTSPGLFQDMYSHSG
mgnify:CR=1 FL=1